MSFHYYSVSDKIKSILIYPEVVKMYSEYYNQYEKPREDLRSRPMEYASLILGIVALVGCTCIYLSLPCGAIAIILATLSRSGEMTYGSKAQAGLMLGIFALVFTVLLYGVSFAALLYEYGSIEGIMDAYSEMSGMDYNELLKELYQSR